MGETWESLGRMKRRQIFGWVAQAGWRVGVGQQRGRRGGPDGGWHEQGCGQRPWCMSQTISQHLISFVTTSIFFLRLVFSSLLFTYQLLFQPWIESPRAQITPYRMNIKNMNPFIKLQLICDTSSWVAAVHETWFKNKKKYYVLHNTHCVGVLLCNIVFNAATCGWSNSYV